MPRCDPNAVAPTARLARVPRAARAVVKVENVERHAARGHIVRRLAAREALIDGCDDEAAVMRGGGIDGAIGTGTWGGGRGNGDGGGLMGAGGQGSGGVAGVGGLGGGARSLKSADSDEVDADALEGDDGGARGDDTLGAGGSGRCSSRREDGGHTPSRALTAHAKTPTIHSPTMTPAIEAHATMRRSECFSGCAAFAQNHCAVAEAGRSLAASS